MFPPSQSVGFDDQNPINYSIPPISEDQLRLWLQNAPSFSTNISLGDDHISNFQSDNSNSSFEDISLHGFDNALSNNTIDMKSTKSHGVDKKEGLGDGEECRPHKRTRSTETHNLNERLRRKKLSQKMAALQEMIPNSVKKDQASTIDDAIKYIKKLQHVVQTMSNEAGRTMFHSPGMTLPQRHQGIETPSLTPFLQTGPVGNGVCSGMPIGYPVPMGLYNPWLIYPSVIGSGLQQVQNNKAQSSESMYANGEAMSKGATR